LSSFKVFIVEDDPFYGRLLQHHLSLNPDYKVELFTTGKACIQELYRKPDVVSIDYGLPDMNGDVLFNKIRAVNSNVPVVIISGQEDISTAVDLLKNGACDYIIKDENTKSLLWQSITNIRKNNALKQEVETLKVQLEEKFSFDSIIGNSKAMQAVYAILKKAVKSNINVSITGETGTGKEVVAKAIHYNSDRSKAPFVAVNMATIPGNLLESELFGHEKGAFTGAVAIKLGKFEVAKEGTLFLDEIAEMDLALQSKILRAVQEREFTRVGGTETIKFQARLLTATHQDLDVQVREGKFREDLYYRIMGLPVVLPALKDRDEDVLLLTDFFMKQYTRENKIKPLKVNRDDKEKLLKYHFPGNVRELKSIVELACVMTDTNSINAEDIRFSGLNSQSAIDYGEKTLREYTLGIVRHYLDKYDNNVVRVAEKLEVGKSTIYNMLKSGELEK
jgi:two-component system response regulator AtoC